MLERGDVLDLLLERVDAFVGFAVLGVEGRDLVALDLL